MTREEKKRAEGPKRRKKKREKYPRAERRSREEGRDSLGEAIREAKGRWNDGVMVGWPEKKRRAEKQRRNEAKKPIRAVPPCDRVVLLAAMDQNEDAQEAARPAEAARAAFGEAAARDLGPRGVEEDVLYVQPWGVEEDALHVQMAFGLGARVVAGLCPPRGCSRFFCAASWTDCGSLRPSQRARGRKRDAPDSETVVGESAVS